MATMPSDGGLQRTNPIPDSSLLSQKRHRTLTQGQITRPEHLEMGVSAKFRSSGHLPFLN
jgi:hypothetical protein